MPPKILVLKNLKETIDTNNLISKLIKEIWDKFSIKFCIGVEIEFYIQAGEEKISLIAEHLKKNFSLFKDFVQERGDTQYELITYPTTDILLLIQEVKNLHMILEELEKIYEVKFLTSPKPYPKDYGNSLHINISISDKSGKNVLKRYLNPIIQALCFHMEETFLIFADELECFKRFNDINKNAPTHISYGGNNRSTAIRIPISGGEDFRFEYRLANPHTDIKLALYTILVTCVKGLENPGVYNNLYKKIYGQAYEEQYNLSPFPKSLEEAIKKFNENFILK